MQKNNEQYLNLKEKDRRETYYSGNVSFYKLLGSIWPNPLRNFKYHVLAIDHFHKSLITTLSFEELI